MSGLSGGPGGPGEQPARRRRPAEGRVALYAALASLVLALASLTWVTMGADTPGGPQSAADPSQAPSPGPGAGGSGGLSGVPADEAGARRPTGEAALVDNPLYDTGRLSPLPCPAPDMNVDDPGSVDRFLNAVADCLDQAWATQFAKAGIPFQPPERIFWTEPGTSPCRDYPSAAGAFYCRANAGIYIGTSDVVEKWNGVQTSAVYASLLAHEYGHHVQGESGLLEYYHEQRRLETEVTDQNAWTRRSELQANCLAGVFLGSVRVSYPLDKAAIDRVIDDASSTADREDGPEDERTHGSAENSILWMEHGLERQSAGACNTWQVADESLVQ
ncbi:neutral zinc metallopeptidase [Nocardiopsis sediminis]|uniref:Neutral zinc metallopeptidase n=1 Tax=Nocardiopsis sediminis TaxID=1778267 RepID=A0ABV8FQQ5_9ACTN